MFLRRIVVLIIGLAVFSLRAQTEFFRHYEVESGLSNNAVMCMVQDTMGFMWFGTRDGLNRFDGSSFKVYRFNDIVNEPSGSSIIHTLHVTKSGILLVGTETNVYQYDPTSDTFKYMFTSEDSPIFKMASDNKDNIWFRAGVILGRYDVLTHKIKTYNVQDYFRIVDITTDSNGVLWVATVDGMLKEYNEVSDSFETFDLFRHSEVTYPNHISRILATDDDKILIGTHRAGFKIFDSKKSDYTDVHFCNEDFDNLFIQCLLQVSSTEIWIGTETGIFVYNLTTKQSKKIEKNTTNQYTISDNVIYSLYKDREGGIWVGTYFGGINYYPRQLTPFRRFFHQPAQNSLSGNIVREIVKDKNGNLWIGTEDAGLNKLNLAKDEFTWYQPDKTAGSISYICAHTLMVNNDELWLGTYEHGLDILNIKTGKVIRHYDASSKSGFRSNFPFCFTKTLDSTIIVGTTDGIYSYDSNKDSFKELEGFPYYGFYMDVLVAKNETIWASIPGQGIYFVNSKKHISGNFVHSPTDSTSISSNRVNSIFEDSRGMLWFATENGLCKFNEETLGFERYGLANGFPSNFILALLEDDHGRLWVSTSKGLCCFNPKTKQVLVYNTSNGLLNDQFNFSSAFKDADNRMYFGSAKGFVSFLPDDFEKDDFVPPVYLTSLYINNSFITNTQKKSPLKQSITHTKHLTLRYNQATFSLEFAALGFTAPENLRYAYKLDGLSDSWTFLKNSRKASFTKLEPGWYTFHVKSSSTGGLWNTNETTLTIEVLPPWWLSGWAYTAYFCVICMGLFYVFYRYNHKMELKKQKEIEALQIAKEKEMIASKIEFFTEVAHEIKTPLTLIKIPLAKVIRKTKEVPEIGNSLKIIEKNTNRLIELSKQLLDFRQTELNAYHLELESVDVIQLLNEAYHNFKNEADARTIDLQLHVAKNELVTYLDIDAFKKIIYNLFSNAIKYGESKVLVVLTLGEQLPNTFTILFKNDGFLIPEIYREKIFEPFFRLKETQAISGTGIGLELARSLAQIHGGTLQLEASENNLNVFSVTLPLRNTK